MQNGHWKKGALTIYYELYSDRIIVDSYLYESKIGHAILNAAHRIATKKSTVDKSKAHIILSVDYLEEKLICNGELATYDLQEKAWTKEPIDNEVIVTWK